LNDRGRATAARLDTLFLAMPVSWKGTLQQYVGRTLSNAPTQLHQQQAPLGLETRKHIS
jgi:hypothetical protein